MRKCFLFVDKQHVMLLALSEEHVRNKEKHEVINSLYIDPQSIP